MSNPFTLRRDFMQRFDMNLPAQPQYHAEALSMWQTMLQEEWQEFMTALQDYRQLPQADAAGQTRLRAELAAEGVDVLNVLIGLLLSQGLPLEEMFAAMAEACMPGEFITGMTFDVHAYHWSDSKSWYFAIDDSGCAHFAEPGSFPSEAVH